MNVLCVVLCNDMNDMNFSNNYSKQVVVFINLL